MKSCRKANNTRLAASCSDVLSKLRSAEVPSLLEHPSGDIGQHEGAQTFASSGSQNLGSDYGGKAQLGSLMSTSSQPGRFCFFTMAIHAVLIKASSRLSGLVKCSRQHQIIWGVSEWILLNTGELTIFADLEVFAWTQTLAAYGERTK